MLNGGGQGGGGGGQNSAIMGAITGGENRSSRWEEAGGAGFAQ